jgi:hypothetical protein
VLDDDRHVGLDHGRIRGIAGTGSGSVRSVEAKVLRTPCRQTDSIGSYRFAFLDIESDQNFGIAIGRVQQTGILVRQQRRQTISVDIDTPELSICGRLAALGIAATTAALLAASAFDIQLGLPTFCCGVATALLVFSRSECRPLDTMRGISWGVLVLVAGLFVLRTLDLGFRNVIALVKGAVQDVV